MWGRVAGDGLDIATLANGLNKDDANKGNIGVAAVLGVAALDVFCERAGPGETASAHYGDRSGFPQPAGEMRVAARSFEIPADMRTPELLRPLTG